MSIAVDLTPPTARGLIAQGVVFRRDPTQGNRIVGLRGPRSACESAAQEITRRADLMAALIPANDGRPVGLLVICSTAPTARVGACSSCGDARRAHEGGQCELCEAALGKALRANGRFK